MNEDKVESLIELKANAYDVIIKMEQLKVELSRWQQILAGFNKKIVELEKLENNG